MSKSTNEKWPDPTDWANRLLVELEQRKIVYEAATDVFDKRNIAANMLAQIVLALKELPPVDGLRVHLPLKDILIMFQDLEQGVKHPWSETEDPFGGNRTPAARAEMQTWATACIEFLVARGMGKNQAVKRVHTVLIATGHCKPDGNPYAESSVKAWTYRADGQRDKVTSRLEGWWSQLLAEHPDEIGRFGEESVALRAVKSALEIPHLRDGCF